jgi:acyl-CoA synthetase (AMP-forming)/AMP-acid ligase II
VNANIARHLDRMAAERPAAPALKLPRGRTRSGEIAYLTLTFAELAAETEAWCGRLEDAGVGRGDRVLVMVRPGLPLIATAFALFKLGAVPVIIDPGMGLRNFLTCVARSRPRVLVGIPLAQILSHLGRRAFRSVEVRVRVSGSPTARLGGGGAGAAAAERKPTAGEVGADPSLAASPPPRAPMAPHELAAILFTSGSTGAPKGVCYEHGMFEAQVKLIRETYQIEPGEIDLPLLPIFALFNPALGMTSIIPELDPGRPAQADPAKLVQAIRQEGVTNSFGSPTLWRNIAGYCSAEGVALPSLRRVLCAGAPVPADLWAAAGQFLPNGRLHSPYGATEALPVSSVAGAEIDPGSVRGACVGRPLTGALVKVIAMTQGPIRGIADVRELPPGEIGELIVAGPMVTQTYDALPEATAAAKIADPAVPGGAWHRLGDCGYVDGAGRLWFCGRQVERVETPGGVFYTEPCEQVFRRHPQARRCALIGWAGAPALVAEARPRGRAGAANLAAELRRLAREHPHTAAIRTFFFHPRFPVDVRHNAKIHRLTLAAWARAGRMRAHAAG